jgi:Asp-tRNA(Asn)/Glu-tRNA(Gln) amidotransferase A subunit family amidase
MMALGRNAMDLTSLTVSEAASALVRGEFSAEAYAEALLAQAARGVALNAFIHHDPEQVRAPPTRHVDARHHSARCTAFRWP